MSPIEIIPEPEDMSPKEKIGLDFEKNEETANRFFHAVEEELKTTQSIPEAIKQVFHKNKFDYTGNLTLFSLIHFVEQRLEKEKTTTKTAA